jgi:hypothetical protein
LGYILQAPHVTLADIGYFHRFHQLHSTSLNMHLTVVKSSDYFMQAHRRDTAMGLKRSMRRVHIGGEKLFVDYAGQTLPLPVAAR